jgi:hypothetical protein
LTAPDRPQPWIGELEPIDDDVGTWVDLSVANSVLAGVLLVIAGAWAMVIFNRLWQGSLAADAAEALTAAQARGLAVRPAGLRARLVAEGQVGSARVRVLWLGGVWGPRSVVEIGDRVRRRPLIRTAEELEAALG